MDVNAVVEECNTLKADTAKIIIENENIRAKNVKMKKEIHEHMAFIQLHDALKASRKGLSKENQLLKEKQANATKKYRKLQSTLFQCKVERKESDLRHELVLLRQKKLNQEELRDKIKEARETRDILVQRQKEMRRQAAEIYSCLEKEKVLKVSLNSERLQCEAIQGENKVTLDQTEAPEAEPRPPPEPDGGDEYY